MVELIHHPVLPAMAAISLTPNLRGMISKVQRFDFFFFLSFDFDPPPD
jgi:hypothetical protein